MKHKDLYIKRFEPLHKNFTYTLHSLSLSNSPPQWFHLLLSSHSPIPYKCNRTRHGPTLPLGTKATTAAPRSISALYIREWTQISTSIGLQDRDQVASDAGKGPARRSIHTSSSLYMNRQERSPTTIPLVSIRKYSETTPATTQGKERYENPVKEPIHG